MTEIYEVGTQIEMLNHQPALGIRIFDDWGDRKIDHEEIARWDILSVNLSSTIFIIPLATIRRETNPSRSSAQNLTTSTPFFRGLLPFVDYFNLFHTIPPAVPLNFKKKKGAHGRSPPFAPSAHSSTQGTISHDVDIARLHHSLAQTEEEMVTRGQFGVGLPISLADDLQDDLAETLPALLAALPDGRH